MTDSTHVTYGASAFVHNPTYQISRAQPAHHFLRASEVVHQPRPGGRGSPPLRAICIFRVAAFDVGAQPTHHFLRASEVVHQPRPGGRGSPPLRRIGSVSACNPCRPSLCAAYTQKGPVLGPVLFMRRNARGHFRPVFTLCLPVSLRRRGQGCRGVRRQSGRRAGTSRLWA